MNRAESSELRLTPELVKATSGRVKEELPDYAWGRGEFANRVLEELVIHFGLPWVTTEVGDIPDWNDPRVQELRRELRKFTPLSP